MGRAVFSSIVFESGVTAAAFSTLLAAWMLLLFPERTRVVCVKQQQWAFSPPRVKFRCAGHLVVDSFAVGDLGHQNDIHTKADGSDQPNGGGSRGRGTDTCREQKVGKRILPDSSAARRNYAHTYIRFIFWYIHLFRFDLCGGTKQHRIEVL